MSEQIRENKMGIMPVGRLLFTMSLPMMISMLVQALYNVVDSYFVAQLSQDALNAVSLSFPLQNLMIGVAVGTGVGVNALLSRSLGEKNFEAANEAAGNGLFLAFVSAIAAIFLGLLLPRTFFLVQTDIPGIVEQGTQYLTICCTCSMGLFIGIMCERLLQSTGNTIYTLATQGVGAVINIIMDPVLIFGLGPFPTMGVAGAAVATVAGQIVGAILGIIFNLAVNRELTFGLKYLKPRGQVVGRIYSVGVPTIVMNSIGSVMVFGINKILMGFTDAATAVFGIYFKLQSFIFMPVFGLNNGMVPIIAYNYGARNRERILRTRKLAIIAAVSIMAVGLAVAELIPAQLLGIFNASDEMLEIGEPALRIICTCFVFAGYGIVSGSVFQALGHGVLSMVTSIVRQLVVLLPAAFLLSLTGRLELVWLAFPIAELSAVVMCMLFNRKIIREVIGPLDDPLPS
ncbi:MATE family efflux transporter [Vermiculatibacterium agrestimuris]|uniref:MATE family efflux transporter n=1 Tax=Vermiculatibacterium agrestimuris TaxID=2941519 RepID=UPI00203C5C1D|nr:MATE family efflux transporter [Vermiculatibacterium agrestimuris]